jgi:hypothetical protein
VGAQPTLRSYFEWRLCASDEGAVVVEDWANTLDVVATV